MKAVILAGGLGTRLAEETAIKPKPMVEIGGKPILWHIMKNYSQHGIKEFVVCLGYKGYVVKEYFANYFLHMSDVTLDLANNQLSFHDSKSEDWRVTLVDTGELSNTGERLLRVKRFLGEESNFCFTYGDGLSDVDIEETISLHEKNQKLVTLTAVTPKSRYGSISASDNLVNSFSEKPARMEGLVNGGFFVVNTRVFDHFEKNNCSWEADMLPKLVNMNQLSCYEHEGFWQSMDTVRDRDVLEALWSSGNAPWKSWDHAQ